MTSVAGLSKARMEDIYGREVSVCDHYYQEDNNLLLSFFFVEVILFF